MTIAELRAFQDGVVNDITDTRMALAAHWPPADESSPAQHTLHKRLDRLLQLNAAIEGVIRCL